MATVNQEIKDLKQEVKELAALVQDNVKGAINDPAGFSLDRRKIKRTAREAGKSVRNIFSATTKHATDARDSCETAIAENPFRALALAVTSGVVLGILLRRK